MVVVIWWCCEEGKAETSYENIKILLKGFLSWRQVVL